MSCWDTSSTDCPLSNGPQAFPMFCMLHSRPHRHLMAGSLCRPQRAMNMNLCRQLVSVHRRLAQLSGIGRKHTNLSTQHHPRESKQRLSASALALQDQEKKYNLKNHPYPHPGGNKKYEAGVSIEKVLESFRISSRANR